MNTIKIVNTHSHVNTLKELNIDEALKNAQNENIITIVPSTSTEDIFEVDKLSKIMMMFTGMLGFSGRSKDFHR